ncbi:hypothetical protein HanIR_Chr06g0289111 [Helianthus annuus]|nr:hypothetical protein HanIR_Chr06g0289111 [Helianthus annuus]
MAVGDPNVTTVDHRNSSSSISAAELHRHPSLPSPSDAALSLSPLLSILPPSCATTQVWWPAVESVTGGVACCRKKEPSPDFLRSPVSGHMQTRGRGESLSSVSVFVVWC